MSQLCVCGHPQDAHDDGEDDCVTWLGLNFYCDCRTFHPNPVDIEKLTAEVQELRANKARLAAEYHALDARCDRYKAALDYLSAQYDLVVDIHSRVRMDTPEDRELHERTIAAMRFAHETVRAALQEES